MIKSIASAIGASNIRFALARVIGRQLDMQSPKFAVCTQMYQACQKCYPVREHGAGLVVKVRSWSQVNCGKHSVVVAYGVFKSYEH